MEELDEGFENEIIKVSRNCENVEGVLLYEIECPFSVFLVFTF